MAEVGPDVRAFVAHQIGLKHPVPGIDLANAIADITIEGTTTGASQLKVTLADPDWSLLTGGWLDTDVDGYLKPIDVVFPSGSDFWWELCAVDATTDLSQPNVTLTFEDRIVAALRQLSGPKQAQRTPSMTRAVFIRSLAQEVGAIKFHCPELRVQQPVQGSPQTPVGTFATSIAPALQGAAITAIGGDVGAALAHPNQAATNPTKKKGVHPKADVTIQGKPLNADQIKNVDITLVVCEKLKAPENAVVGIMVAGIGESAFKTHNRNPTSGADGVFQLLPSTAKSTGLSPYDTAATAEYWLKTGYYNKGGGIALANKGESPGQIAVDVEGSGVAPGFYGKHEREARALIAAYGGAGGLAAASSTGPGGDQGVYAFARGTSEDPDEDSWTCMNRLASEVNWSLFSNGNTLYYMDGPDLIGQKPSLVLDRGRDGDVIALLEFTWDNSAFAGRSSRKARAKAQRKSSLSKVNTPTEGKLHLVCGEDDYRAGEVFELRWCGPANGRWIVTAAVRSVFNTFTEFTLSPPTAPIPEPAADRTSGGTASSAVASRVPAGRIPAGGTVGYPEEKPAKNLGGVAAHASRPLGNWQSDNAIDLGNPVGTKCVACVDGIISPNGLGFGESSGGPTVYGKRLHIVGEGNTFFYQHMADYAPGIAPGVHVKRGDVVGSIGAKGDIPPHLHFASMQGDPQKLIGM